MKKLMMAAILSGFAVAPAKGAPPILMSADVKNDVQCFVLYAVAVNNAESSKDESVKEAGSLGMMYFLGKLRAKAPGLNFVEAVRQEATALETDPQTQEIGDACDVEFQKRGAELLDLGTQLRQPEPQSPPAS